MRKHFLLTLAKELKQAKSDAERASIRAKLASEYNLTEADWALIDFVYENRQFTVLKYWNGKAAGDDKYIGDFAPITVMQDDLKEEVKDDYKEVMRRFTGAVKKLRIEVKKQ